MCASLVRSGSRAVIGTSRLCHLALSRYSMFNQSVLPTIQSSANRWSTTHRIPQMPFLKTFTVSREDWGGIVHKRKRDIGERLHPRYAALLGRLGNSDAFMAIAPDVSALCIIERSEVVISMPFTSTALLGRHVGKPSIFYDPHGIVQKDDRAAHGVPIVTGRAELERWLSAHLSPVVPFGESAARGAEGASW